MNRLVFSELQSVIKDRDVYIWGAGYYGDCVHKKCCDQGIAVKGFLDKNPQLEGTQLKGLPISNPSVLEQYIDKKPFVMLGAPTSVNKMESYLLKQGFIKDADFYSTSNNIEYFIDISGTCNLVCPSCPRGNSPQNAIKGFMDIALFKAIVEKIQSEEKNLMPLALYNWGEPFLHPNLADFIRHLKEKNIYTVLSSNMSLEKSIDAALRANPDWLKISLSGYYQATYATTHTGGNSNLVKSNLYRIKYLIDKYKLTTKVEVNYHKYLNNLGEDWQKMKDLCQELDFILHDVEAYFMPIERKIDHYNHKLVKHLEELQNLFINKAVLDVNSTPERVKLPCFYQSKQVAIDCNGKVQLCCQTYDDINTFDIDYLRTPLQTIVDRKLQHKFCDECKTCGQALQ
ncbi:hypothetical protein FACS1894199_16610 [Bacteroidia bacterium]|nr:hypothetical protein FACS1894199_16610 [Bacteroidia bacterium]